MIVWMKILDLSVSQTDLIDVEKYRNWNGVTNGWPVDRTYRTFWPAQKKKNKIESKKKVISMGFMIDEWLLISNSIFPTIP